MEPKKKETDATYWHSAFYAGIQIELEDEAENRGEYFRYRYVAVSDECLRMCHCHYYQ